MKKINKSIYFIIMMVTLIGCHKIPERIYEKEISKINQRVENPLKNAMELIDLKASDLRRPEYYEAGYNMICRMPIIDAVSTSPFILQKWADETSIRLINKMNVSSNDVLKILIESNRSLLLDQSAQKAIPMIGLQHAYREMCYAHRSSVDKNTLKMIKAAGLSKEFDKQLGILVYQISEASLMAKKAFSSLNKEENDFLISVPERFFFTDGIQFKFLTAPVFTQEKISFITRKIDFSKLYISADMVTQAVVRFIGFIKKQHDPSNGYCYFKNKEKGKGVILKIPSPIGDIVILGQEQNIVDGNAALLIDLGGNDTYRGNIANGRLMPGRISVAIDVNGDDVYENGINRFSQGFGCLSVGMLVDLEGNDKYISGNMGQGAGIYGIGVLEDLEGDDIYLMGLMGQGFGVFGTGILLDRSGNDRYMINGLGQGTGSTMGFGCLTDLDGNDKYIADSKKTRGNLIPDNLMNHVQGAGLSIRSPEWTKHFSLYGGIGFLNDGNGNDFYYSDGGNCMGSSYFMSIGALVDHDGNDYYTPEKGYGIGSAVHLTNAVFIDRKGNDQYVAKYHSGGVASDQSVAIMVDYEGNDIYGPSYDYLKEKIQNEFADKKEKISTSNLKKIINKHMADASYGAALKPYALGMLIDYKGDDQYFSRTDGHGESFGGVIPPSDPAHWSHAIQMDLSGKDHYFQKGLKDNHYLKYFGHGLCYDINYKGNDLLNNSNINIAKDFKLRNINVDIKLNNEIADVLKSDFFVRYSVIGKIVKHGDDNIFEIIDLLKKSNDNNLNRDLIEILNIFIIKNRLNKTHQKYIENLLHAKDPFVRSFTAHILGTYKAEHSVQALMQSINDKDDKVRSYIIWALGRLDDPIAYEALIHTALKDPSIHCRREGVKALAAHIKKSIKSEDIKKEKQMLDALMACAADGDNCIRANAANGLKSYIKADHVRNTLNKLLKDKNVYVRRFAAKALIETGNKEAILVLIETLKYPSIDTFEFYGHDLIKEIAFYCGIDFPIETRYLYSTWAKWWKKNEKNVNIEKNLKIRNQIKEAFFVKHESKGVETFKRLLKENPENILIKNNFVQFCNEWINYKFLTKETITASILEKCVDLQKNIIEMEPEDSKHRVKLAGFYARLSNYEKAAELMKSAVNIEPENKSYIKTWMEYKKRAED